MASSSNPPDASARIQDLEYMYASNTNVSNFVSVKLSGDRNYHLWKKQMRCLMKTHDMCGLVDDGPMSMKMNKYDSLLQGWILGSVNEDVLRIIVDLDSAKDVWIKLESCFNSTTMSQPGFASTKTEIKTKTKDTNVDLGGAVGVFLSQVTELETKDSIQMKVDKKIRTEDENRETETKSRLQRAIADRDWDEVCVLVENRDGISITEKINSEGNTVLHIAVGVGPKDVIRRLLWRISGDLSGIINDDGSTLLHIAAIVGNTDAAKLLISRDTKLLDVKDGNNKTPLDKAYEKMHLETSAYLLEAAEMHEARKRKEKEAEADKQRKKAAEADKKNKKAAKVDRKDKEAADGDLKSKEAADGEGKIKGALDDDEKLMEEPDVDGTGKEEPDVDEKGKAEPDVDGKVKEEPDVDEKGKEEPDVDGDVKEEPDENGKGKEAAQVSDDSHLPHLEIGADLLVKAISAKKYEFALKLVTKNHKYAVSNDDVLMAIARSFPSELDYGETLFYPRLDNLCEKIVERTTNLFDLLVGIALSVKESMSSIFSCENEFTDVVMYGVWLILGVSAAMVYWMFLLILLLLLMVYFPFFMLYYLFWEVTKRVVPQIKNIEQKKNEYEEAKKVLDLVCNKIYKHCAGNYESFYKRPILEAACQNAYKVVVEILRKWPEAIQCKDENGYDIIQLATIHRSEKIYNLIYIIGDRKNMYRTMKDSSENNMLHLAGRLAPSNKLKLRTGAALQLQRELQWQAEVKKLVFPSYATKDNIFKDTPDMVFTKEHENLVKEGEKWIKTVAESCSITAALITTIVFAAAITVPGGSSQEGVPVFMKEVAFTIFAIADAISLFSSATALLVFLSILTARFAEQDFLVRLPRRVIIGLCTLLLSTTSMMVAFGATLFLVFCHDKVWMLAPLCGLAFLPIAIFFILQFPLILDLFWSTYISKFGKSNHNSSKFNPNDILLFFGK